MKTFDHLLTLHIGLNLGGIMLSVEYYNKNVKYVEITDPIKESL